MGISANASNTDNGERTMYGVFGALRTGPVGTLTDREQAVALLEANTTSCAAHNLKLNTETMKMQHSTVKRPSCRRISSFSFQLTLLSALTILAACAPVVGPPALSSLGVETPKDFPEQNYQAKSLPAPGKVFRIDAQLSDLRILVYRGGELARFGHNHVVTSTDIQGFVLRAEDILASRFDLFMPVDRLMVDDPLIRAEEGVDFSRAVSEKDGDGTRSNMLGDKVLDAAQFPFLQLGGKLIAASESELTLDVDVTMHGITQTVQTVANMSETSHRLTVEGMFNLRQTDFGIEPFSALLGRMRVEDEVTVKYRIVAEAQP